MRDLHVAGTVATAGWTLVDQGEQCGDDRLRSRPVRDVLAGEGPLVHLGAHVARVEGIGT